MRVSLCCRRSWKNWRRNSARGTVKFWGLIYKTVLRKDHYRWRTEETQEMRAHKNFLIYNRVRTHVLRLFPFINPKSTWKRTQVDQPRVPPSHHQHATINGQCKAPHGYKHMEMSSSLVLPNESRALQTDRQTDRLKP